MNDPVFDRVRRAYRSIVPTAIRHRLRVVARELPIRLNDLPADVRERLHSGDAPVPPPFLRHRVGIDSSRAHFEDVGRKVADDVLGAFRTLGLSLDEYPRWLDFGCGAGRAARHLAAQPWIRRLTGVDVDAAAIRWASQHLRDEYVHIGSAPPTPFASESFDVVYVISVFTHFDEENQNAWLAELRRLLRPGGIFLATTHGPGLTYNRPDMTAVDHERLRDYGFAFRPGFGAFNDESAFHSREYLERHWTRYFEVLEFRPAGLAGYLDLSLWRR